MSRCRWCALRRCRCSCSPARSGRTRSPWSLRARGPMSSSGATNCSRRSCCASSARASRSTPKSYSNSSTPIWGLRSRVAGLRGVDSCWRPDATTRSSVRISPAPRRPPPSRPSTDQRSQPRQVQNTSLDRLRDRAAAVFRSLEQARARGVARVGDLARAVPALGAGGSRCDGPRRRGSFSISRPPSLRILRALARQEKTAGNA